MIENLVSVVIPTHNRKAMLLRAIESALAQTWTPLEVIVIDDASSDGTASLLHRLSEQDSRIRFIASSTPMGGAGARNEGIKIAKGKYVALLDDDDVWDPAKLKTQIGLLERHPQAVAVSCGFVVERGTAGTINIHVAPSRDAQHLLQVNHLGGASMCLTTKQALVQVGGFDTGLRSCQDWDIWVKLQKLGPILVSDQLLVRYWEHHGGRITKNLSSVYSGHRKFYFRYRKEMTAVTRKRHMGELLFLRQMLKGNGLVSVAVWFFRMRAVIGFARTMRYGYRYGKFRVLG